MTTELRAQTLTAGQTATFGQGRILLIKTAAYPLTLEAVNNGGGITPRVFTNVGQGFKFKAEKGDGWDYLRVTSASAQSIELVIGDDDFDYTGLLSGAVVITEYPSQAISIGTSAVNNGTSLTHAGSSTQRRLTIQASSSNAGTLRIISNSSLFPNLGLELTPGGSIELKTAATVYVRNDTGAACLYTWVQEQ